MPGELVRYERTPSGLHVRPAVNLSLSGVNIFGNLGKVIGEVILYRIEARRSQARLRDLQIRAGVASRIIDSHTRIQLADMAEKARALDSALSMLGETLAQQRETADALIRALKNAQVQVSRLGTSPNLREDRKIAMDFQVECAKVLAEFTLKSTQGTVGSLSAMRLVAPSPSHELVAELRRALPS